MKNIFQGLRDLFFNEVYFDELLCFRGSPAQRVAKSEFERDLGAFWLCLHAWTNENILLARTIAYQTNLCVE